MYVYSLSALMVTPKEEMIAGQMRKGSGETQNRKGVYNH